MSDSEIPSGTPNVTQPVVVNVCAQNDSSAKPSERAKAGFLRDNWQILTAIVVIILALPAGWMSVQLAKKDVLQSQELLDLSKKTYEETLKSTRESLGKTADANTDLVMQLGKATGSLENSEIRIKNLNDQLDLAFKANDTITETVKKQKATLAALEEDIRISKVAIAGRTAETLAKDEEFRRLTIQSMSGEITSLQLRLSKIEKCVSELPFVVIPTTGTSHPLISIKDRSAIYVIRYAGPSSRDLIEVVSFSAFPSASIGFKHSIIGSTPSNADNNGAIVKARYEYDDRTFQVKVTLETDQSVVYQNVTAYILEIKPQ